MGVPFHYCASRLERRYCCFAMNYAIPYSRLRDIVVSLLCVPHHEQNVNVCVPQCVRTNQGDWNLNNIRIHHSGDCATWVHSWRMIGRCNTVYHNRSSLFVVEWIVRILFPPGAVHLLSVYFFSVSIPTILNKMARGPCDLNFWNPQQWGYLLNN